MLHDVLNDLIAKAISELENTPSVPILYRLSRTIHHRLASTSTKEEPIESDTLASIRSLPPQVIDQI